MSKEHIKDKDERSERVKSLVVYEFEDEYNEFFEKITFHRLYWYKVFD